MLINQSSKGNKENQNPVLIINQQEQMKQNGILPKNHFTKRVPERYSSTVQCMGMKKCTSSRSLQEQIEKIARKLKQKQDKENVQMPNNLHQCSIDEMVDILQDDKLLHIRSFQMQLSSQKNRHRSRKSLFPPLQLKQNFQSFETTKSSENETIIQKPEIRHRFYSKPTSFPQQKTECRDSFRNEDQRKKRTISQVIEPQTKPLTKKERIDKALSNTQRIIELFEPIRKDQFRECGSNSFTNEELEQLIQTDQFKLEFECLIFQSNNSQNCKQQLQDFMISQIRKYKDLQQAEQEHKRRKANLDQMIDDYLSELRNKL